MLDFSVKGGGFFLACMGYHGQNLNRYGLFSETNGDHIAHLHGVRRPGRFSVYHNPLIVAGFIGHRATFNQPRYF